MTKILQFCDKTAAALHYVGTHSVDSSLLDANGNAAALPLAAFFEQPVAERYTMRDVIVAQPEALAGCFDNDPSKSDEYQQIFYTCLTAQPEHPSTHERNKQILWPIHPDADHYHTVVPLYPSRLAYEMYLNINERRWGEQAKKARENRKDATLEQFPYQEVLELASVQLGGTKPQNISLLNSKQRGQHYLLPSMPPYFEARDFSLGVNEENIFTSRAYRYRMYKKIKMLVDVIQEDRNTMEIRERRDGILADILSETFEIAEFLQKQKPGWTNDIALNFEQSLWLDPNNPDSDFQEDRLLENWRDAVEIQFASWLQETLKQQFQNSKRVRSSDFGEPEFQFWKSAMHDAVQASQLLCQGVFQ